MKRTQAELLQTDVSIMIAQKCQRVQSKIYSGGALKLKNYSGVP